VLRLGGSTWLSPGIPQNQGELKHVSTYPTVPTQSGQSTVSAPSKPGTLKAAMFVAIAAGLAAIVDGVLILAGGIELAKEVSISALAQESGISIEEATQTAGGAILDVVAKEVQSTLASRAYMALVFGGLLLVFGLLMNKGALWARILVTITGVLTVLFAGRIATDVGTTVMLALGWVAALAALVAIVLAWLPANGRYAKAIKQG
jgi:hypothetical protein